MNPVITSSFTALLTASLLMGCVQTNSVMMDQRTAVISTKVQKTGSGFDILAQGDNATLLKGALKEAAALTLKNGYRYFELLNTRDQTRMVNFTSSGSTTCNGMVMNNGAPGAAQPFNANCLTSAPSTTTVAEPAIDILVRMYMAEEIDPKKEGVFDANWVAAQN